MPATRARASGLQGPRSVGPDCRVAFGTGGDMGVREKERGSGGRQEGTREVCERGRVKEAKLGTGESA